MRTLLEWHGGRFLRRELDGSFTDVGTEINMAFLSYRFVAGHVEILVTSLALGGYAILQMPGSRVRSYVTRTAQYAFAGATPRERFSFALRVKGENVALWPIKPSVPLPPDWRQRAERFEEEYMRLVGGAA